MQRRKFITGIAATAVLAGAPLGAATSSAQPADAGKLAGWSSTFTYNAKGWSSVRGAWYRQAGKWRSDGLPGYWTSTKHGGYWGNFVYQAKVKRDGNGGGYWANALTIRGNPYSLSGDYRWLPSYHFNFTNTGYFSVWRNNYDGSETAIKGWTYSSLVENAYWKNMKVVAQGNFFAFSINGRTLWSGYIYDVSSGMVGFSYYTDSSYWSTLQIDTASLQTISARDKVTLDPPAELGATLSGGSSMRSPK